MVIFVVRCISGDNPESQLQRREDDSGSFKPNPGKKVDLLVLVSIDVNFQLCYHGFVMLVQSGVRSASTPCGPPGPIHPRIVSVIRRP
jgi:hypothetical protein